MKLREFLFYIIVAIAFGINLHATFASNNIPSCQEDEIIIGTGDYSDGRWDSYNCSHKDILS